MILRIYFIKKNDNESMQKCQHFLELYETDYMVYSNNARAVYEKRQGNIPEELPRENDIKLIRVASISKIKEYVNIANTEGLNASQYRELMQYTFVRVLSFNARRGGEPSKVTLSDWDGVEKDRWKKSLDIENLTNPVEKLLAQRLRLCYIEGKKKRKGSRSKALVPILFTEEVVDAVRVLIKNREIAKISPDNVFVFASGKEHHRLRGWDTLQSVAKKHELSHPHLITPTRTRKYLATMLQLMDLTEAELNWVTNHLGHTKDVHFAWYRKEDSTLELTKMATILTAVDENKQLKNQKIDDLLDQEPIIPKNVKTMATKVKTSEPCSVEPRRTGQCF